MPTHNDIKTVAYLDPILNYAESRLGIRLTPTGKYRYSSFCPFRADTKDSFRLYVDGNDVVRFHCFGECKGDWDIYDVIMLREKCSFRQAQQIWADYLGIKDVDFYRGESQNIPEPDAEPEPDDSVEFLEPAEPGEQIKATLAEAATFYNELLLSDSEKYSKVLTYLARRGAEKSTIERFRIGHSPVYVDAENGGIGLIITLLFRLKTTIVPNTPTLVYRYRCHLSHTGNYLEGKFAWKSVDIRYGIGGLWPISGKMSVTCGSLVG